MDRNGYITDIGYFAIFAQLQEGYVFRTYVSMYVNLYISPYSLNGLMNFDTQDVVSYVLIVKVS